MTLPDRMAFAICRGLAHHAARTLDDADADVARTHSAALEISHEHDDGELCVASVPSAARRLSSPPSFASSGWPPAVSSPLSRAAT